MGSIAAGLLSVFIGPLNKGLLETKTGRKDTVTSRVECFLHG